MSADQPRVLVVGAGSIGTRHARCLIDAGAAVTVVDPIPERAGAIEGASVQPSLEDALGAGDHQAILVASPTSEHLSHARLALDTTARVLVEKPLAIEPADAAALAELGGDRLCVAYNLRFHEPVQRFVSLVHTGELGSVSALRLWFGSWLPDWRPTIDYRTSYSAQRALGGGVLLDAIHELDMLLWVTDGQPAEVVGSPIVDRLGPLEIDVEDTVKALLRTEGGMAIELSLDYLSRRYRRGMEAIGADATARLDWAKEQLEVEDDRGTTTREADFTVAHSYERQAEALVAWAGGGPSLPVSGHLGAASVALARAIRDAAG